MANEDIEAKRRQDEEDERLSISLNSSIHTSVIQDMENEKPKEALIDNVPSNPRKFFSAFIGFLSLGALAASVFFFIAAPIALMIVVPILSAFLGGRLGLFFDSKYEKASNTKASITNMQNESIEQLGTTQQAQVNKQELLKKFAEEPNSNFLSDYNNSSENKLDTQVIEQDKEQPYKNMQEIK